MTFTPDYTNLVRAARNCEAPRLPLYDHIVSDAVMEKILGRPFASLIQGDAAEVEEYFRIYCDFFRRMGYDTVSYEGLITAIMPEHGCLYGHRESALQTAADIERYPWQELPAYFERAYKPRFDALRRGLPPGMKAVGGAGNGIFECVQDIIGFTNLCYLRIDDPDAYAALFRHVGEANLRIWEWVIAEYSDVFCVFRFGDDLGFKSTTLLPPADIRNFILPQYRPIIRAVHAADRPFLLHSCGCIFDVMEDILATGIDAKHSNEDTIAPFPVWVERYGDRIGNFGGADVDMVSRLSRPELKEYVTDVLNACRGHGGIAFGTGNSVPDYMPVEAYLNMNELAREYRGDYHA